MAHILVVDDHAIFREPIKVILEQAGYSVDTAAGAREALAAISSRRPDVLLLDLKMPLMDGETLLHRLRAMPMGSDVQVIVLTCATSRSRVVRLAQLGVHAYLSKEDFCVDRLLATVQAAIIHCHAEMPPNQPRAASAPLLRIEPTAQGGLRPVRSKLRSVQTLLQRSQVMHYLKNYGELKAISPSVSAVLSLTANPDCSVDDVVAAIGADPGLSVKMLKLANSCAFSPTAEIDSIRRAVVHIGISKIRQCVLSLGVIDRMRCEGKESPIQSGDFWAHSVAVAVIAAELARDTCADEVDAAFTCGLLHDIGRLVLIELLGETYAKVVETADQLRLPLDQVELRMLSVRHADVMETLLQSWGFPRSLVAPICQHHTPIPEGPLRTRRLNPASLRVILANRLAHALMLGYSGDSALAETAGLCDALGIRQPTIERIEAESEARTHELQAGLLQAMDSAVTPRYVDRCRSAMGNRPVVHFLGDCAASDAYRMACSRLGATKGGTPSVIVVHAVGSSMLRELLDRVASAEREIGVVNLPVLVLNPSQDADLSMLHPRVSMILETPCTIADLIQSLAELADSPLAHAA